LLVQDGKFLNCVDTQVAAKHTAGGAVRVIVQADAVQAVIVLLRAGSGNCELLAEAAIAAIRANGESWLRLDGRNAGLKSARSVQLRPLRGSSRTVLAVTTALMSELWSWTSEPGRSPPPCSRSFLHAT